MERKCATDDDQRVAWWWRTLGVPTGCTREGFQRARRDDMQCIDRQREQSGNNWALGLLVWVLRECEGRMRDAGGSLTRDSDQSKREKHVLLLGARNGQDWSMRAIWSSCMSRAVFFPGPAVHHWRRIGSTLIRRSGLLHQSGRRRMLCGASSSFHKVTGRPKTNGRKANTSVLIRAIDRVHPRLPCAIDRQVLIDALPRSCSRTKGLL
jgi:hypothetical protein